jgi:hypothetical protein
MNRYRILTMSVDWRHYGILLAALVTAACGQTSTSTTTGPSPTKCTVSLAASDSPMNATGATAAVGITTQPECRWNASAEGGWITDVAPTAGQGSGEVRFRVLPNPTGRTRQGAVIVNDQRLQVLQDAATCRVQAAISRPQFGASGGDGTIAVSAPEGCSWIATSNSGWITISSGATGAGSGRVAVQAARNGGAARSGTITIGDAVISVNQSAAANAADPGSNPGGSPAPGGNPNPGGAPNPGGNQGPGSQPCVTSIQPASVSSPAAGGSHTVAVTSTQGCAWTATSPVFWIAITGGAAGSGNGTVEFSVAANIAAARSATLTIAGRPFTVSQAVLCTYAITPANSTITHFGGTGTVAVTSPTSCAWTATSNAGWITITSGTSGSGNGSVAYRVAGNSQNTRTGSLTIAGNTFTVTQMFCSYALSRSDQSVSAAGGTFSVSLSTAPGCPWTATSRVSWITVTSGASGSGNGTVGFLVLPNAGAARSGTLAIDGQSFTVDQAALIGP